MYTHTAIFKGVIREVTWDFYIPKGRAMYSNNYEYEITETDYYGFRKLATGKEREIFWTGEIAKPIFEVGEKVYISELDLLVRITDRYRTTNGEMIYETSHIIRDIETENLEKSRLLAVSRWFREEFSYYKTFEDIKAIYEPKKEPEREEYNLEIEEKPKEKTWFGWLDFFKKTN